MNNIFIYANFFSVYQYLCIFKKVINFDIDKIILLNETIGFNNSFVNDFILTYNTLEECISNSTSVFIINDEVENLNQLLKIEKLANHIGLKIYYINNYRKNFSLHINQIQEEKPCITIFNYGHSTMNMITEVMINDMIYSIDENINFCFSNQLHNLLNSLSDYEIINPKYINNMNECDIQVQFIELNNDLDFLKEKFELINNLKMDYVIVLIDYDFVDYDLFSNYIKCLFSKNVDIYVKSRWLFCGDNINCHVDQILTVNDAKDFHVIDIEDTEFYMKLLFDIKSKFFIMKGVKRL